jgi:tetratricopeptide (TPR) repeat protein
MSLFVDVNEVLSDKIKSGLMQIIEQEKQNHERPVRKACETCYKYLDYGELRYDKMEDGIRLLQEKDRQGNALYQLLLAVFNESLDEDEAAIGHFIKFSETPLAETLREDLEDFITIGRVVTLKEHDGLRDAGSVLIGRYSDEENISDILSNLYLRFEKKEFIPVFQQLFQLAEERYPACIPLMSFNGYILVNAGDYSKALELFLQIKDLLEEDKENPFYFHNLASTWDGIAVCYLGLGDAAKTIESCDAATVYDLQAGDHRVGNSILHKKAEGLLLLDQKEEALKIITHLLTEDSKDEKALDLKKRISEK